MVRNSWDYSGGLSRCYRCILNRYRGLIQKFTASPARNAQYPQAFSTSIRASMITARYTFIIGQWNCQRHVLYSGTGKEMQDQIHNKAAVPARKRLFCECSAIETGFAGDHNGISTAQQRGLGHPGFCISQGWTAGARICMSVSPFTIILGGIVWEN